MAKLSKSKKTSATSTQKRHKTLPIPASVTYIQGYRQTTAWCSSTSKRIAPPTKLQFLAVTLKASESTQTLLRMVATMAIDLTPRWDNFAVYLPAIQKSYAKAAYKIEDRDRVMPEGITQKDLNFLNPKSKLWHYGYGLYSAGQFKNGEQQTDIVTNRADGITILGDSGGYQVGKPLVKRIEAKPADFLTRGTTRRRAPGKMGSPHHSCCERRMQDLRDALALQ